MRAYTDYPFDFLGDTPGEEAPIREVKVISYDQDKRCKILVEGVETEVKRGYLYKIPGRCGDVETINTQYVKDDKGHYKNSKAAQITRSWLVYPPEDVEYTGPIRCRFLKLALKKAYALGEGSTVIDSLRVDHRDGSGTWTSGNIEYEIYSHKNEPNKPKK